MRDDILLVRVLGWAGLFAENAARHDDVVL
jgi:hypothetical protein